MRILLRQRFLCFALLFLTGCGFRVNEGKVQDKVELLQKTFGIPWPTNWTKAYGGSLSVAGSFSDIVVRLEISEATFSEWRQSATNRLKEYQGFPASADSKLEERFAWWDCAKLPASRVAAFFNDDRAGIENGGKVRAFVVETNGMCIMYIHGSPMR